MPRQPVLEVSIRENLKELLGELSIIIGAPFAAYMSSLCGGWWWLLGGRQDWLHISLTFRDMQEERGELIKKVFPRLRKICEQRGLTWGEVDQRWGISDEQKAEHEVLPICLERFGVAALSILTSILYNRNLIPSTIIQMPPILEK